MASDFKDTKPDCSVSSSSSSRVGAPHPMETRPESHLSIYLFPSWVYKSLVCSQAREGTYNPQQKGKWRHPEMPGSHTQQSMEVFPCRAENCPVRLIPNGISAQVTLLSLGCSKGSKCFPCCHPEITGRFLKMLCLHMMKN